MGGLNGAYSKPDMVCLCRRNRDMLCPVFCTIFSSGLIFYNRQAFLFQSIQLERLSAVYFLATKGLGTRVASDIFINVSADEFRRPANTNDPFIQAEI